MTAPIRCSCVVATLAVVIAVPGITSSLVHGEDAAPPPIVTAIAGAELFQQMQADGQEVTLDKDGHVRWKIRGLNPVLLMAEDARSIRFRGVVRNSKATPERINDWNRNKLFSRSFLQADNIAVVALDLDLTGGVTRDHLQHFLKTCRTSFVSWIEEVAM